MRKTHTQRVARSSGLPAAGDLVKQARTKKGLTQGEFGRIFNKSQGEVSRYENREFEPPIDIVMHCMHELGLIDTPQPEITVEQLSRFIKERLKGPKHNVTRKLLVDLIDRLA